MVLVVSFGLGDSDEGLTSRLTNYPAVTVGAQTKSTNLQNQVCFDQDLFFSFRSSGYAIIRSVDWWWMVQKHPNNYNPPRVSSLVLGTEEQERNEPRDGNIIEESIDLSQ